MGQCMSRKAAGAFAASAANVHNRPSKGKHTKYHSPDDDNKESTVTMRKNNVNSSSKGVAMSFGFKRRTTPSSTLTTSNNNVAKRLANPDNLIDSNGNDNDDETKPLTSHIQASGRSTPKLPPPKKEKNASQGVSRFGFRQPQVNRMNKVADLNLEPLEFGTVGANVETHHKPLTSNTVSFQKYKPNFTSVETTPSVDNNRNRTNVVKTNVHTSQIGKYTLQTTQLPKPQPVRVMETKTAKTLANNNMRLGNVYRRSSPDDSSKDGSLTEDSGVGSHGGTDLDNSSISPTGTHRNLEIMLKKNLFDVRDASSEVPLPKLPCSFRKTPDNSVFRGTGTVRERTLEYERQLDKDLRRKISPTYSESSAANIRQDNDLNLHKYSSVQKSFLKTKPSPVNTFLKSKIIDNKGYSSSASSDEHEWAFGGEAMADEVSFSISSSDESRDMEKTPDFFDKKTSPFIKKTLPTLPLRNEFKSITLSIVKPEVDPYFANANFSNTLLNDETSPIDSLLSFSESDEATKKKTESEDSKDVNEKQTPASSPSTPTNASNSLSLSEGKDDFLIDDEIADQPALVFGDKSQQNSETTIVESTPRSRRKKLRNFEGSPLILKDKRGLRSRTVSLDTLSPCESIASDDLMMDYEYSQSSGLDDCDKLDKMNERNGHIFEETLIGSLETDAKNNEQIRDWSALLNCSNDKNSKGSKTRFLRSRTGTPNSVSDSPSSLDGKLTNRAARPSATSSPLRRLAHATSLGHESDDSVVKLDRATHASMKNDMVSVKTMLLKLRRVLNEQTNEDTLLMSETRNPFENNTNGHFNGFSSGASSCSETEENATKHHELVDLKRQILFLQGELEDKEEKILSLQNQMTKICVNNYLSNSAPASTVNTDKEMCNAATQTERVRPVSVGPLLPNGSQTESTPGSLVSVNELQLRTIESNARISYPQSKRTTIKERRNVLENTSSSRISNPSTSISRRSNSRTRAAPSSST